MSTQRGKLLCLATLSLVFLGAMSQSASARWPNRGGGWGYGSTYGRYSPGIGYGVTRNYVPRYGGYQSYYPRSYGTTIYRGGVYGSPYYGSRYYGNSYYGSPYRNSYGSRYYGGGRGNFYLRF